MGQGDSGSQHQGAVRQLARPDCPQCVFFVADRRWKTILCRASTRIPGGEIWVTGSATLADLDGDGHVELILINYFADGSAVLDSKATTPIYMPHSQTRAFNGGGVRIYRCFPVGEENPSRGLAIADVNGDGKLDMVVANMWGPATYYHNECRGSRMISTAYPVAMHTSVCTTECSNPITMWPRKLKP